MGGVLSAIAAGPTPIKIDPTLALQRRIQLGDLQAQQMERQAQAQDIQLKTQLQQRTLQNQFNLSASFRDADGDPEQTVNLARNRGVDASYLQQYQEAHEKMVQTRMQNSEAENKLAVQHHDQARAGLETIAQLPEDQRPEAYQGWLNSDAKQVLPPKEWQTLAQLHPEYQGAGPLAMLSATFNTGSKVAEEANNRIKAQTEQQQAANATSREKREQARQDAELPGITADAQRKQMVTDLIKQAQADPTKGAAAIDAALPSSVDAQANAGYKSAWSAAMQGGSPEAAAKIVEAAAQHSASLSPATQKAATDKAVATAKAEMPIKVATAGAEAKARADAMTPPAEAMDMMAEQTLAGKPVPMGRNPILAGKIYERAAQLAQQRGLTSQQAVMEGFASKANQNALNSVTKQYETLKPFAEMAEKNANVLEQKMQRVTNLGASFLNTPIREFEQKFTGNSDVSAFKAAMMPVQADFARILNSPTGNGVLSDNARHEMQAAISPGATPSQIKAALDVFRTDARNRKDAYEQQLQDLKSRTVVGGPQSPTANAQPKATHRYNTTTGKIEPIQ